jgi:hypothetical protein
MVAGGVNADGGGHPSALGDCIGINGPNDSMGGSGLWGSQAKGAAGSRLFVAHTAPNVASATVTLTSGLVLTGHTVNVPGTGYNGLAIAIPSHHTIASVDMYDTHHHRIDHDTT